MNLSTIAKRSKSAAGSAWRPAWKTAKWLLKITIPVSFVVFLLNFTGVLQLLAEATNPFFSLLGLPSQTALVLITSMLTNIYSVIAVISMLGLPVREGLILAVMCLISHGFIIESAVLQKTGSSIVRMLFLRFLSSLVAGVVLGLFLPEFPGVVKGGLPHTVLPFGEAVTAWMLLMARMSLKIIVLITLLMVLQRMMEEFGLLKLLSRWLGPFMRLLGLVPEATLSWLVANAIGLAYGSAIILDEVEKGRLSRREADLLNHHTAISHSQLEDPILFFAIGLPMWWLIWPRFLLAVIAVWLRRAELYLTNRMKTQPKG
ncbi:MAG: nucleoside recognition protein [Bacteroidales bacterium]|nr:nucleoside recognition protein [Bacteroidales bacterium]MDD3666667.1 nucleoside recognition protein [Bacteroidales bacterium]